LLGCPDGSDCLLEEDICLENLPQDAAEGVSIHPGETALVTVKKYGMMDVRPRKWIPLLLNLLLLFLGFPC